MPEIWSLSLTASGVGASAIALDASYRTHFVPLSHSPCAAAALFEAIAQSFEFLFSSGSKPEVITILSEENSVFVNKAGEARTPVYFSSPLTIPRSEIPEVFGVDAVLGTIYRNSVLRRLQRQMPQLGQSEPLGITTATGLLVHALCGTQADALAPLGTSVPYPYDDVMAYRALGTSAALSAKVVRHGRPVALINDIESLNAKSAPIGPWRDKLLGVPLFLSGHASAGVAYASAANPLSWSATLGWQATAQWTASATSLAKYEITIKDKIGEQNSEPPQTNEQNSLNFAEERTRDEWTATLASKLSLNERVGCRRDDHVFGLQTPRYDSTIVRASHELIQKTLLSQSDANDLVAHDILSQSPIGSAGLHLWPQNDVISMTGMTHAHNHAHLVRAVFESQGYQLRAWRDQTGLNGLGPLRVSFDAPWDLSCAQNLCDLLGELIIVIDEPVATLSALGGAIALMRDLDLAQAAPHVPALQLSPGEAARRYQQHYTVHQAVST